LGPFLQGNFACLFDYNPAKKGIVAPHPAKKPALGIIIAVISHVMAGFGICSFVKVAAMTPFLTEAFEIS